MDPVQIASLELGKSYQRHHALVLRTAYRITGNAADAEDVLQTVFLRLLRRGPDSAAVVNVGSYLHRAAVNCALDIVRAKLTAVRVPLEEAEPRLAANSPQASGREPAPGEIRQWLRQALARQSPASAEMFALRFIEGMDNLAIAEALGTTAGTVAVTLHRTRGRLQKELRDYLRRGT